jgi:hypothetical protein
MFTRTLQLSSSAIVAAILSLSIASLAHAEIVKCVDSDGLIVYSNTSCGDAVTLGVITDNAALSASPSAQLKKNTISSGDRGQIRETAWTHRDVPVSKKALDKSTIRDARHALTESDRAITALRHPTLASND